MLRPYDDSWPAAAERRLTDLRRALLPLAPDAAFDHIGSTSVPGLAAKPFLDLQVRMSRLPDPVALDAALVTVGFHPHAGSRPDSPGVHRDTPRGSEQVPDEVWEKRLFTAEEAARYERTKRGLAEEHADDPDYDHYTRAKTAYFDQVQASIERMP